jgi:hypothetical protein
MVTFIPLTLFAGILASFIITVLFFTRRIWRRSGVDQGILTPKFLVLASLLILFTTSITLGIIAYQEARSTTEATILSPHAHCNFPSGACPEESYSSWRENILRKYEPIWGLAMTEHSLRLLSGLSNACITGAIDACELADQIPVVESSRNSILRITALQVLLTLAIVAAIVYRAKRLGLFID